MTVHPSSPEGGAPPDPGTLAALESLLARHGRSAGAGCPETAAAGDASGLVGTAVTVRSRTPGLGACATRLVLARATAEGRPATHVVIDGQWRRLCGLCLQTLLELAPQAEVFPIDARPPASVPWRTLLPSPFVAFVPESTHGGSDGE